MRLIALFASLLFLAACSKLTLANYDKLKVGMSFEEVSAIIGNPEKCDENLGIKSCSWSQGESLVTANFVGGQAILLNASNLK